jgi:hypothetical protein
MDPGQEQLFAGAQLAGEWRIANAAGGFAQGPAAGPPMRREHAWLHAWENGRATTMLLGLEEEVHAAGQAYALSELSIEDAAREKLAEIESFASEPFPCWRLRCGELLLERSLFLISGQQAVAVRYRHLTGPSARLRLGPLMVARDPDQVQRETSELRGLTHGIPGRVRIETVPGRPTLTLWHNGTFLPARLWRRGISYAADSHPAEREDAFVPGTIDCPLPPQASAHLVAATDESLFRDLAVDGRLGSPPPATLADCVSTLERFERTRHREFSDATVRGLTVTSRQAAAAHEETTLAAEDFLAPDEPWIARLVRGLEGGLARRGGRLTVLTANGVEHGAYALRAAPGLIAAQAFEVVRGMLSGFLGYADDGAVPSGFAASGAPQYEDPTAALWLLIDAELLTRRSEDPAWARVSLGPLESLPQHLRAGSRYGVRADADGLLQIAGDPPSKPLVLNTLWYYALIAITQLARLGGRKESAAFYLAWARQHGQSFQEQFWDEENGALFEEIAGGARRPGLSAEQILAVAFAPPLLAPEHAARLLERVERELFTPLGLRPHPRAAHAETAWLGAFHSACLRVRGRSAEVQGVVRSRLERLSACLDRVATDHVPAAFAPPPRKGGKRAADEPLERWLPAGASAVAAAELLRLWVEDVAHPAGSAATP